MKKLKKVVCGVMLSATLLAPIALSPLPVCATDTKSQIDVYEQQKKIKSIVFVIGQDHYFINNDTQGVKMDAKPFIQDDRTFVPVRYLGYALGLAEKDIVWKNDIQQVVMRGQITSVEMTVGSKAVATYSTDKLISNTLEFTDKKLEIIDVAPLLKAEESRTYLPARYIAEGLGYQIEWDAENGIVLCYPKGDPKPDISAVVEHIQQIKSGVVQPEQPQIQQPPVTDSSSNGYTLPSKTDLHVDIRPANDNPNKVDIQMAIRLQKPLEQQYQDAYNILNSKFGEEIAKQIVDYVKQKKTDYDVLLDKYWYPNGQKINVGSDKGNYWIVITAWQAGV